MRFWLLLMVSLGALGAETRVLDDGMHHLGVTGDPEWDEFRGVPVETLPFEVRFTAAKNTNDWTLFARQRDVKLDWPVRLNGRAFTNLTASEDDLVNAFTIRAGLLNDGTNTLTFAAPRGRDDIEVGQIRLEARPVREALAEGAVKVRVTEGGKAIPCRVTVVDSNGSLAPILVEATNAAVRTGVAYLGEGQGTFRLRAGSYTFYAGRGFEYSVSTQQVTLARGGKLDLDLSLTREVSTPGLVACDTHVHTWTYSRHGDATEQERAITLAGEGIELPIATDHNLVMDPVAPAKATGMDRHYTPVAGNEVTTGHAHFNIFPVEVGSKSPNFRINERPRLMEELRGAPGVKVVILNHPRNVHNNFQPFAATNFNAETGENLRGFEFSFDATEIVNSSAMQSDWMLTFRDWMALLNYGYRVTGLGSSDGHDVSRYIVGQGRTYIEVDDSDVSRINVDRACESVLKGRALISMGLLTQMKVNGRFGVGDLATNVGEEIEVTVTVQGPGWTAADHVQLFENRELIKEERFEAVYAPGEKRRFAWKIARPKGDAHLIAIASGPGVRALFWPIAKPYQASSTTFNPRVIGATNPIWIDANGDGKFTPPRLQ